MEACPCQLLLPLLLVLLLQPQADESYDLPSALAALSTLKTLMETPTHTLMSHHITKMMQLRVVFQLV